MFVVPSADSYSIETEPDPVSRRLSEGTVVTNLL